MTFHDFPGRPVGRVRFSLPASGDGGKAPSFAALPTRRPREALGGATGGSPGETMGKPQKYDRFRMVSYVGMSQCHVYHPSN